MNWQEKKDNWQPTERYLKREESKLIMKMVSKMPSSYKSWWSYLKDSQKSKVFRRYQSIYFKKNFSNTLFWEWCHSDIKLDKFEIRKRRINDIYDE